MKQLMMRRCERTAPSYSMPCGFTVLPFRKGDEAAWLAIARHGLFHTKMTLEEAEKDLNSFPCLKREEDIFFAAKNGKRIATATGMLKENGAGYLHYICALPEARGTGVAAALVTHAMRHLYEKGASYVYLTTDDFRLGAIKTYLRLGLVPVIEDEEDEKRWSAVFLALGIERKF
jgi:mycothiol synthase